MLEPDHPHLHHQEEEETEDSERITLLPRAQENIATALSEQARKDLARKRVQRIFKLPLTFKKPRGVRPSESNIFTEITPTPISSAAAEIKRFQASRPDCHFLITDYCKSQIQVKCEKDFRNAARPEWGVVRWVHLDTMNSTCLPILKENLPAPILLKDITRPFTKFRVEEHERYVLVILQLIVDDEGAAASRRNHSATAKQANEITTIRLVLYLFFESNTLVTVTENPGSKLADCILTRLSREPSRIRSSDCSYLLYYILKFTLAPLQMIINYHSAYLEMMEDKIIYQHMEVVSYQNIFHEIHEIRRELQHLRARLINIGDAIDDIREISDREQEAKAPVLAAAQAFAQGSPSVERNGIFPHRLKVASIVRLQFKHLSANTSQMALQTTTLQEVCSWLADLVFQTLSQKMNQTMKTLTLISMIFIPLTFIVGVYGTNFEYLPELRWKYGYAFLWGLCVGVVVIELIMFRRLRWI